MSRISSTLSPPFRGRRHRGAPRADADRLLTEVFERHHQEIYRYCLGIVRSGPDAEDALQATMAAAFKKLPELDPEGIKPWLYRVAHNESISILRSRRTDELEAETLESGAGSAQVQLEQREELRTLIADLRSLPDRQRGALLMREMSGLSYAEIATAFESSEGAVRQVVHEAREALAVAAEGRSMECVEVRDLIDAGDRRKLRGRRVRAHLDSCEACGGFLVAYEQRRHAYAALCPPLPLAAASTILAGTLASAGAASGTAALGVGASAVGAGAAGSVGAVGGTAMATKGASALAAIVLATGAAEATGVADLPGPIGFGAERSSTEAAPQPGSGSTPGSAIDADGPGKSADPGGTRGEADRGKSSDRGGQSENSAKGSDRGRSGSAPGRVGGGPGAASDLPGRGGSGSGAGEPATPGSGSAPGQSGSAPGQGGGSPGNSGAAPGRSGPTPSNGASPGNSAAAPGQGGGGGQSTAPGQTATAPGKSAKAPDGSGATAPGNSGSAPGRSDSGGPGASGDRGSSGSAPGRGQGAGAAAVAALMPR